ncbi:hypothetical protein GCM10022281_03570 [Sphingomonas rosea]|uniref:Uncharacterized protein n=1 Tax=Sphingomonas rosea TaxID=335605 RepID=A0ABP7TLI3_9SPHN
MAADPRLTLPEHLRQFADGQFHLAQQDKQAQPTRVGNGLKQLGEGKGCCHGHKDIKISLYLQALACPKSVRRNSRLHGAPASPKSARWLDPKMGGSL